MDLGEPLFVSAGEVYTKFYEFHISERCSRAFHSPQLWLDVRYATGFAIEQDISEKQTRSGV